MARPRYRGAFVGEWRRVLADRGVFSLLIVAPVFYGVFYPQPYLGQLVRKIPIAVVDDDRTALSRRLIQALDADEAISVAVRAPALDVAQQALFARQVFGILEIPPDTEREVLKGNAARIPAYVDSAYFLVFNRTLQGIAEGAARHQPRRYFARRACGRCASPGCSGRTEPGRIVDGAAVQSDRRLRQLRRAGRFCADHPADPADGGGDPDRPRLRERSAECPGSTCSAAASRI